MKPFKTTYYISDLRITEKERTALAKFKINGLLFKMCLRGFTKEEQQEIEFDHNTVLWDDDNFNEFFFEFFEQYRKILQYYIKIDPATMTKYQVLFIRTLQTAIGPKGVEIVDYKKCVRTAYKIYSC